MPQLYGRTIMKKTLIILAVLALALSCGNRKSGEKLQLVTTTGFVSHAVSRIAGDRIEITELMEYRQDPHSYEPSPRDMAAVEKADLIFVNGFDLEEGLLKVLKNTATGKMIELSATVDPIEREGDHDDHHHEKDPHTWMSPLNVVKWIEIITSSLGEISPQNASYFEENRKVYQQELQNLHETIKVKLSVLERGEKVLVTDHDSFSYYAREYGFEVKGTIIPGTSSNSDTSTAALIKLINQLKEAHISTIFLGDSSGPDMEKMAENIRSELDFPIKIISLKTGSMDDNGKDSYSRYMMENTDLIIRGLKGK